MKVLLLGYGKMGKTIEKILLEKGYQVLIADTEKERDKLEEKPDVAIEFSIPDAAAGNIRYCLNNSIPVVSGTTGWLKEKPEIDQLSERTKTPFFYASNFSIGVNIFFQLNKKMAAVMNRFEKYDVSMQEIHHIHKLDEPSGTAITLAEDILKNNDRKEEWVLQKESARERQPRLEIKSIREGEVPGTHEVKYESAEDQIILRHEAFSRKGFASGAVQIAEWIVDKNGPLSMDDFLGNIMDT